METNLGLLFLLIGTFGATRFVKAQHQTGFISLDCGLVPKDLSYTEVTTNITYISDATVIDVGEIKNIKPDLTGKYQQQMWSLGAFSEGVRNCYNLQNLKKGDRCLIRASFLCGNYDGLNVLPSFDIHIGPNLWSSVEIFSTDDSMSLELVHVLKSNQLQVCLVKTGLTVPFITSLELKPFRNDTYITQRGSLMNFNRWFLSSSKDFIRFEEDIHDRAWNPFFDNKWMQISTSFAINTIGGYKVPALALKTPAMPRNANEPLSIVWTDTDKSSGYYAYLYFEEIEMLKANEGRQLVISLNEELPPEPFSPPNLTLRTIKSQRALTSENGTYALQLQQTNKSTHPPLLNAIELYKVLRFFRIRNRPK